MKNKKTTPLYSFIAIALLMHPTTLPFDSGEIVGKIGHAFGAVIAGGVLIYGGTLVLKTQEAISLRSVACKKAERDIEEIKQTYAASSKQKDLLEQSQKILTIIKNHPHEKNLKEVIGEQFITHIEKAHALNLEMQFDEEFYDQDLDALKHVLSYMADECKNDEEYRKKILELADTYNSFVKELNKSKAAHQEFLSKLTSAQLKYSEERSFFKHFNNAGKYPDQNESQVWNIQSPAVKTGAAVATLVAAKIAHDITFGKSE